MVNSKLMNAQIFFFLVYFTISIPDTLSALLVPPCSLFVDYYGHRATLLFISSVMIALVHLTLGFTFIIPWIPLTFLGLSYAFYGVAIWPSIACLVTHEEEKLENQNQSQSGGHEIKLLGTAYGLSTSILNMALTITPLLAALVRSHTGGFVSVECLFTMMAGGGALVSLWLWMRDASHGGLLQGVDRTEEEKNQKEEDEESIIGNNQNGHGHGEGGLNIYHLTKEPTNTDMDPKNKVNENWWIGDDEHYFNEPESSISQSNDEE